VSKKAGITVESWLETWLERQKKHLKSSPFDDYKKICMNTLGPAMGTVYLADLRRTHVRGFVRQT
jgi:integrase